MAWNNGFPANYQPMYTPQFTPQQMQPFPQQMIPQAQQMQPTQMSVANQPQMLTPPTIRAEIVQVDSENAAAAFPVGAGASQMMIAKDESAIFIKSAMANGQRFDPEVYVRKDELETLVSAAVVAQMEQIQHQPQAAAPVTTAKRPTAKREDA